MSSPAVTATDAAPASAATAEDQPSQDHWPGGLPALRAELDRIDDILHDLLMERARVVEHVARSGKRSAFRPGREASIIRRLLARHTGKLPRQALVRIWREMLAGTTAMQGPFSVAVCQPDTAAGYVQVAREHFGALTPVQVHQSPAHAIAQVRAGTTAVAVLPLPSETETARDAWWTALLHQEAPRIYVVARLPFWSRRPEGAPAVQALVIAATPPDTSEHDRSLLGLEIDPTMSRARLTAALATAGLPAETVILRREPGGQAARALADVEGNLTDNDPRLAGIGSVLHPPVVLGAYAVPEGGTE